MRIVAVEEHFSTREVLEADNLGMSVGGEAYPTEEVLNLGERRLADMDRWGIDVQVISLTAPGAQQLAAKEAVPLVRAANDRLAGAVAKHPNRMAALAALPMADPRAATEELERCVRESGFKGAVVNGRVRGRYLDAPEFWPVLEQAATLGVPLYLHPTPPPPAVTEAYYGGFSGEASTIMAGAGWGWHIETGVHLLRMMLGGVFDRLPELQVVVGHLGEALPFMAPRANERLPQKVTGLQRPISLYFSENVHISIAGFFYLAPFLNALQEFGADRIMFSVDYPFSGNEEGVAFLDSIPVSPQDREKIAHGNAERLFRL